MADAHYRMGDLLREQGLFDAAEQSFQNAVRFDPDSAPSYYQLGKMQHLQSRVKEAADSYSKVLAINPACTEAYWSKSRLLPVIYDSEEQIDYYRNSYADGLRGLTEELSLDSASDKSDALKGIAVSTNFYLQYQGRDDLKLQKLYGELVHRVMAAAYPQWAVPLDLPPLEPNGKIRIGYASTFLRDHNGAV